MTAHQAEAALRVMLRHLRRRAGKISQAEIRKYEAAIRALARQLTARGTTPITKARAQSLGRAMDHILTEVDAVLQQVAARSIKTISTEITTQYQTVHARLYHAQGLPSGGVVQRFEVVPQRTLKRLATLGGRRFSLPRVVTKNVDMARTSVETYIRAATGKVPDEVAVRSILRLLDGKLPVDLPGLGLKETQLTGAKGLLHRGRRILATESFNTMREATAEGSARSPIIIVGHWGLSDGHADLPSSPDECDDIATADVGYGPGWYLPEHWPKAPHPHCACPQDDTRVLDPSDWPAK